MEYCHQTNLEALFGRHIVCKYFDSHRDLKRNRLKRRMHIGLMINGKDTHTHMQQVLSSSIAPFDQFLLKTFGRHPQIPSW